MNEEETKVEVTATEDVKTEEVKTEETQAAEPVSETVVESEAPVAEKKDLDLTQMFDVVKKNIKWIAIGVAALIVICIIGSIAANSGSRFATIEEENSYMKLESDLVVNFDGDEITFDENVAVLTSSADQSLTVATDTENTLFVLDDAEAVEVAKEVGFYTLSVYGDAIAYVADVEDSVGTLYLYNVSKKKSVEIAEEVYAGDIVLSADGKSVAYVGDCEVEEGWYSNTVSGTVFVSKNGKAGKEVSSDAMPLAVSDDGKYVFYIKDEDKLFMNEEKLGTEINSGVFFNQDGTEIVFIEDDDTMYFTAKMKEPVKVKKGSFSGIYAPATMVQNTVMTANGRYVMKYLGVDSFDETLWRIDYSEAYYVFDKGEETEKLGSSVTTYQMTENGKSMLYLDGSELVKIENISKSREGESIARGLYYVNKFVASEDLKDIYYYDSDEDELRYLKKGEGVRIADDAENFVYSDKYGVLYFIEDDELFYATTSAKSVKDVCGEEVTMVYADKNAVYFILQEDDTYSVMKMTGKAKYESVLELDQEDIWNLSVN
ncbi:MAG: hypothetical protein J6K04_14130 [Lachnospiraceae bacterium]|nr:hypothetical protein [Lachnospiraceae bacterium]